jgi:hypothetical protein
MNLLILLLATILTTTAHTNPFINPTAWRIFLTALEARRAEFETLGH